MKNKGATWLVALGAVAGFLFAAVATYDFVAHLDRQVHGIHCSFIPGLGGADASGTSGCHVTLMSPYSSVFRSDFWGGIPISLPAMSVFGFLFACAIYLRLSRKESDPEVTGFVALASAVPVLASIVMGYLSFIELDTACKLCIGIYLSSAVVFFGSITLWRGASSDGSAGVGTIAEAADTVQDSPGPVRNRFGIVFTLGAAAGLAFVLIPVGVYAAKAPDFRPYLGSCGNLQRPQAPEDVLVGIGDTGGHVPALEVLDPLCPACRAFERRVQQTDVDAKLDRQALLFPLDNSCNWMVSETIHPGACAVSEAILCAGSRGPEVLTWAFEEQEAILTAARTNPEAAATMIKARFPGLGGCVGSAKVKARLNLGLRFAVDNQMPVLTPQLYVRGQRLCDEDTDLGLAYMLTKMAAGTGPVRSEIPGAVQPGVSPGRGEQ